MRLDNLCFGQGQAVADENGALRLGGRGNGGDGRTVEIATSAARESEKRWNMARRTVNPLDGHKTSRNTSK